MGVSSKSHPFSWSGTRKMPLFRQSGAAECGLACLGMVAWHFGYESDLPTLRRTHEITLKGASLNNLVDIGNNLGLGSRSVKCPIEDLDCLRLPAIIHWDLHHFVVLKSIKKNRFEIYDPADGRLLVSPDELSKHYTGIAIELTPTANFTPKNEKNSIGLSSLLRFDSRRIKPIIQALLLSFFLQGFVLLAPFFLQLTIDEAILKSDITLLVAIAIGFGALKIFEIVTVIFRRIIFQLIAKVLTFDLKASLFHHLLRLPMSYFNSRGVGDVQQRFNSLTVISNFVVDGLIEAIIDGILAVTIGALLFAYSPQLALIVLLFVLSYLSLRLIFLRITKRLETDQQVAWSKEANVFLETITSMQTLRVAGIENEREGIWRNLASASINSDIKVGNVEITFDALSEGLVGLSQIFVVFVAALAVINGDITVGMIIAFLAYKVQFETRLLSLFDKWIGYKVLEVHLDRVADLALTEREPNAITGIRSKEYSGEVEIRNLQFRYAPTEPDVLKSANLKIEAGQFVAISGPSGQGKSTLLKLVVGIIQPNNGELLFDGHPLSSWGAPNLRKQIGVVMQDDRLLSGTLSENISLFESNPDLEKIEWAAATACIIDEINAMPMGLNTLVGSMGTTLSGGQQQRVMIARALYREPKLLVLDEGTSSLDLATEERINIALRELKITRIAAAHRPDTLERADRVLVVINGTIYEDGKEITAPRVRLLK